MNRREIKLLLAVLVLLAGFISLAFEAKKTKLPPGIWLRMVNVNGVWRVAEIKLGEGTTETNILLNFNIK